mgnify:CR=1 FL=1
MILTIEQSAVVGPYRSSFKTIFVRVITAITILYLFFGVSGYLSYGEETRDVITLNIEQSEEGLMHWWSGAVKLCLCSSLFLTYPLMMFPVTNILKRRISETCRCKDVSAMIYFVNCDFTYIYLIFLG